MSHDMRRYGDNPAATIPWQPSIVPSALSPHTRDKAAVVLCKCIIPHRCHVLTSWVVREASHAIPKTVYADKKEADMKADAITSC